jgi:hypothetical protein
VVISGCDASRRQRHGQFLRDFNAAAVAYMRVGNVSVLSLDAHLGGRPRLRCGMRRPARCATIPRCTGQRNATRCHVRGQEVSDPLKNQCGSLVFFFGPVSSRQAVCRPRGAGAPIGTLRPVPRAAPVRAVAQAWVRLGTQARIFPLVGRVEAGRQEAEARQRRVARRQQAA